MGKKHVGSASEPYRLAATLRPSSQNSGRPSEYKVEEVEGRTSEVRKKKGGWCPGAPPPNAIFTNGTSQPKTARGGSKQAWRLRGNPSKTWTRPPLAAGVHGAQVSPVAHACCARSRNNADVHTFKVATPAQLCCS